MNEPTDLREVLQSWPFDPEHDARITRFADGRMVLQVRLPLGIEQYEMTGRPDGGRPHGKESALDFQQERLAKCQAAHNPFALNPEECAELFNEGTLYYFRYLHLFQLGEWRDTVRDTGRNLALFDFVRRHAEREEDREYLEKWRPYILRMNSMARAMIALESRRHGEALETVEAAIRGIEALPELDDDTFRFERHRSIAGLRDLAAQIVRNKPLSELERLERDLHKAVSAEHFEQAARLRDRIRELRRRSGKS